MGGFPRYSRRMSNARLFLSITGVLLAVATFFKFYLDWKVNQIREQLRALQDQSKQLTDYMVVKSLRE